MRTWPVVAVAAALTLIFAIVAGVAGSAAVAELIRGPSPEELRQASLTEVAGRWQRWQAGRIFPATLAYTSEQGARERARRVGISTRVDCRTAVDATLAASLQRSGCRAVLRATYIDALQGIEVTLGVAAFPDVRAAGSARAAFPDDGRPSPGLRALPFPGTVTDRFAQAGRQAATVRQAGPYLVIATAGQVDGRPARALERQRPTMFSFVGDLTQDVADVLTAQAAPVCSGAEWRC
ncbi:hypothetical protein JOL79_27945 [Microbispora sp. RL4-1S]|uniref:Uncharacterized protein n=2 Tax=Microbispora oryzae TaxID=2806554 RepID=A0A941AKM1_9ACTN|nr:hypothetical protein [Microbispora oryzae]